MISHSKSLLAFVLVILGGISLPYLVIAQEFVSMVGIPGVTGDLNTSTGFNTYVNALYIFAITAGAILAVLKLVAAGVKYMFSDIVTTKQDAIGDIKGALLGLLIVIGAVVILNTVNPDLTNVDLSAETLTNLPSGSVNFVVRNVIEHCRQTRGCQNISITREQCAALRGHYEEGSWWGVNPFTSTPFYNTCVILPPRDCVIPPERFTCDVVVNPPSCTCFRDNTDQLTEILGQLPSDFDGRSYSIMPTPRSAYSLRRDLLITEGYEHLSETGTFNVNFDSLLNRVSDCIQGSRGDHIEVIYNQPNANQVRVACWRRPV